MSARLVSDGEMSSIPFPMNGSNEQSCSQFSFETVADLENLDPFDLFPSSGEIAATTRYLDLSRVVREPHGAHSEILQPRPRGGRLIIMSTTEAETTP
jgi:hypothetical protein